MEWWGAYGAAVVGEEDSVRGAGEEEARAGHHLPDRGSFRQGPWGFELG